jgi:pilus assembly protein Flp/PilA
LLGGDLGNFGMWQLAGSEVTRDDIPPFEDPDVTWKIGSSVVRKVFKLLNGVRKDEEGVTMAEYAILIGLIAVVSITIIGTVGTDIAAVFTSVASQLGTVT